VRSGRRCARSAGGEELGDLVLERLLEDQASTKPADGLDRVGLSVDAVEHLVELTAESL